MQTKEKVRSFQLGPTSYYPCSHIGKIAAKETNPTNNSEEPLGWSRGVSLSELFVHVSNLIPRLLSVVPSHPRIPEARKVPISSGFDFCSSLDGFLLKFLASRVLL